LAKPEPSPRPKRLGYYTAAAMAVAALAVLAIYMAKAPAQKQIVQREATPTNKARSSRPANWAGTLDPAQFTGRTARAYQAAAQIPEVLEKVFCYCGCDVIAGHSSDLDCFRDKHAAG
jgi:hypothetical protein